MSTLKTTNITHGSNSGTANMVLASDGKVTATKVQIDSSGPTTTIDGTDDLTAASALTLFSTNNTDGSKHGIGFAGAGV